MTEAQKRAVREIRNEVQNIQIRSDHFADEEYGEIANNIERQLDALEADGKCKIIHLPDDGWYFYKCSKCDSPLLDYPEKYCPECGREIEATT